MCRASGGMPFVHVRNMQPCRAATCLHGVPGKHMLDRAHPSRGLWSRPVMGKCAGEACQWWIQADAARGAAAAERVAAAEAAAAEQQARLEGEAAALARAQLALETDRDQLKAQHPIGSSDFFVEGIFLRHCKFHAHIRMCMPAITCSCAN